jgi:membrane protein
MRRLLGWLLGGLAAGAALGALRRPVLEPMHLDSGSAAPDGGIDGSGLIQPGRAPDRQPTTRRTVVAIARRMRERVKVNNTSLIAGSLAYYAMLSIFPAAIAAAAIYGLVLQPAQLEAQIADISSALPAEASQLVLRQLREIVSGSGSGLGLAAVVSIIGALWSASAGVKALIVGINVAYGITETRKFLALRGIALLITLGSILFVLSAVAVATFVPELSVLGDPARQAITWLRWPVIFLSVLFGLGVVYKLAPNRPARTFPWLSIGSVVAAVTWVVATVGFSFYTTNIGNFNATYGALGGVIVLLLWFFISGFVVLLGAELNAELERADIH